MFPCRNTEGLGGMMFPCRNSGNPRSRQDPSASRVGITENEPEVRGNATWRTVAIARFQHFCFSAAAAAVSRWSAGESGIFAITDSVIPAITDIVTSVSTDAVKALINCSTDTITRLLQAALAKSCAWRSRPDRIL